ncbi:MAG: hypothetical protein ACYC8W_06475 [Candidatus Tyrphobacter sp.]
MRYHLEIMRLVAIVIAWALALPVAAAASQTATAGRTLNATTQIPDTTYRVIVSQVQDATHILVRFQDGDRAVLAAGRPTMTFAAVHPGDTLMLSTEKGAVLVFKDYGVQSDPAPTSRP